MANDRTVTRFFRDPPSRSLARPDALKQLAEAFGEYVRRNLAEYAKEYQKVSALENLEPVLSKVSEELLEYVTPFPLQTPLTRRRDLTFTFPGSPLTQVFEELRNALPEYEAKLAKWERWQETVGARKRSIEEELTRPSLPRIGLWEEVLDEVHPGFLYALRDSSNWKMVQKALRSGADDEILRLVAQASREEAARLTQDADGQREAKAKSKATKYHFSRSDRELHTFIVRQDQSAFKKYDNATLSKKYRSGAREALNRNFTPESFRSSLKRIRQNENYPSSAEIKKSGQA